MSRAAKIYPSAPPLIMVVDDLDVTRKIRSVVLQRAGYRVSEANNGADALRKAAVEPPDLLISDILMPVMDGFELCRAWKSDKRLTHIPFVFYSVTYTQPQDQAFALRLGADAFLPKGADNEEFLREINRIMDAPRRSAKRPAQGVREEGAFYREHSERVVRKLEDKLRELEKANADVRAREDDLRKAKRELEQRVAERTAELEAINKELESFAYTVSHDLRAPLRLISALSAEIEERFAGSAPATLVGGTQGIRRATQRMSTLIDELLKLSRVAPRVLNRQRVDLSAMAAEVMEELAQDTPARNVKVDIQPGLTLVADPPLLRIAIYNLLDNALKYTSTRARAEIRVGSRVEQGETVYFVRDNGVGFEQSEASNLFKPFQRLSTAESFAGTGIGLATVARIIHRHGGGVWAQGTRAEGAVFYFSLPET